MERERHLTAFDAQFLAGEAGNMTSNYCALAICGPDPDGRPLTAQRVHDLIAARIDRIPALRWRLRSTPFGLDHPAFVDGEVDLAEHVVAHALPPGAGLREAADIVAGVLATRLDRRRPLWQFHVIAGLEGDRTAVGMIFHHAAADALGAARLMTLLLDHDPSGRDDLPDPVDRLDPPAYGRVAIRTAARSATHPVRALRAGIKALPHLDQVPMMRTLPGVRRLGGLARRNGPFLHAPRVRFNGPLSPGRSVAFGSVPVDMVGTVKRAHGVTFNDVVVAAVAGGLRRRLAAAGELPGEPLLAFVPFNVRTSTHDGAIANAISSFVAPVPTHLEDAGERVRAAHEGMAAVKARHDSAPSTLLEDANELIFPLVFGPLAAGLLRLMGTGLIAPPLNLILSNVPGPAARLYLDGCPVESIAPLSLAFDGVTLNITVASYAGRLEIGVVGDRERVADAWELVRDIEDELAAMHAAVG